MLGKLWSANPTEQTMRTTSSLNLVRKGIQKFSRWTVKKDLYTGQFENLNFTKHRIEHIAGVWPSDAAPYRTGPKTRE